MTQSAILYVLGVIALGVLLLMLPRGIARAIASIRISRRLHSDRRVRDADLDRAAAYHERLPEPERADSLDDRTWQDLDLDQVFLSLDQTVSEPGRQYLYHLLRTPQQRVEPLPRLERVVRGFAADHATAGRVRTALHRLDDPRAGHVVDLLFGDLPHRPRLWWLFPLLTLGSVACLILMPIWPYAALWWLGICVANIAVQIFYKPRVKRLVAALHELPAFLGAAGALAALPIQECANERQLLREGAKKLASLRRATWWLMFEPGQTNEVAASLYEYVNLAFLLDINAFVLAIETIRDSGAMMRAMFEAIGYMDAAQSIATWRSTLPQWTTPEFTEPRKALHTEELVHPLIADAVPNSFDVANASVLITGSNMSGKTTFVRTVGVSAVLAQTLHTVCARVWRAPLLRVRTSIGRADSIMDGKSYYLAEAESVLALVRAKESGHQHLFLLDEIFRGTNTTERVAAGYAVLAHLNRGADLVLVATHDLELLELLNGAYAPHHFREQIVDGALTFGYRIQDGPSSTRNAIALLAHLQYPEPLVADACAALLLARERPER